MQRIFPVILSGGSGSRLWPLSREALPKQLLRLHGERTMIQETVLRAAFSAAAAPIIICNEAHRFLVAEQMQEIGVEPGGIVLEPVGRNTAPAVAVAALRVAETDPDGVLLILPSDHVIADRPAFAAAVAAARAAAEAGYLVTFGMCPGAPETGYGYIEVGETVPGLEGVRAVARFTEKPDLATAELFVAGGRHHWNSGMFVFTAKMLLDEMARHAPEVLVGAKEALAKAVIDADFVRLDKTAFAATPSISIDYAVMEKTDRAAIVPCQIGWNDVGAWSALWAIAERDGNGNVFVGDILAHDAYDCLVHSDKKLAALVGVKDLAIVVTEDAVLVADRARAQDVKAIVDRLKADKRDEHVTHRKVYRPWGSYDSIDSGEGFQVKQIVVKPGGRLSLQMHNKRAEHWIVVRGTARVTVDDKVFELSENQSTFIPLGATHRLENLGSEPVHLIEVQCGSYLGEDDIVRFDDVYGRA